VDLKVKIIKIILFFIFSGLLYAEDTETESLTALNNDLKLPDMFEDSYTTNFFIISNMSKTKSVEITAVRPTCGCTFANAESNVIMPGGKIKIIFGFHSSRQPNITERKSIHVLTKDQALILRFSAFVKPMFKYESSVIDFGSFPIDPAKRNVVTRTIEFIPHESCSNVKIGETIFNNRYLKVDTTWLSETRKIVVTVTVDLKKVEQNFLNEPITFKFYCGDIERQLPIRVYAAFRD